MQAKLNPQLLNSNQNVYALQHTAASSQLTGFAATDGMGTSDYTIHFIFKHISGQQDRLTPNQEVVANGSFNTPFVSISDTAINIQRSANGSYTASYSPGTTNWHQVIVRRTSGVITAHIDGQSVSLSASGTDYDQNGYSFSSGAYTYSRFIYAGTSYYYSSSVDEIALWKRSISTDEIAELYNNGKFKRISSTRGVGATNLVALLHLDEGTGTALSPEVGSSASTNGAWVRGPVKNEGGLNFPGFVEILDFTSAGSESSVSVTVDGDTDKEYKVVILNTSTSQAVYFRLNNDSGASSYGWQYLANSNGSISAYRQADSYMARVYFPASLVTLSLLTPTGFIKTAFNDEQYYASGTTVFAYYLWGHSYNSTSNITSLNMVSASGNFTAGTRITVWARRSQ